MSCLSAQFVSSGLVPDWQDCTAPGPGAVSMLYLPCHTSRLLGEKHPDSVAPFATYTLLKVLFLLSVYMYTSPPPSYEGYFLLVMASTLLALDPPHGGTSAATFLLVFLQLPPHRFFPISPAFISETEEILPLCLMLPSQKKWLRVLLAWQFCTWSRKIG